MTVKITFYGDRTTSPPPGMLVHGGQKMEKA